MQRIRNAETLTSHGHRLGRSHCLQILEAGLDAADPFDATLRLVRLDGRRLLIGDSSFEPSGAPVTGTESFDLDAVGKILVVGAGKGVMRVAEALEHVLGERITGGHIVCKHGDEVNLKRIGVTFGAHPVPDQGCVLGCQRILACLRDLDRTDLVFTIGANGISSLLTLPVPGVTLDEVRQTTYIMQIERGAPTQDLNIIRNHLDVLKGGKITRYLQPAFAIHILAYDPDYNPSGYDTGWENLMHGNRFLHFLPDSSTFPQAVDALKSWNAWEAVPAGVRETLLRAEPAQDTLKIDEFLQTRHRVFGVLPRRLGTVPAASRRSKELGYCPIVLASFLQAEARHVGTVMAQIAKTAEREGTPCEPPCVFVTSGEHLVTVGHETGVGGRNQEWALSAALTIADSRNIVMGGVDTDGTDGPGGQFLSGWDIPTLAGGLVDGETVAEARAAGIDIATELSRHNSTAPLWRLRSGIWTAPGVGMNDLNVALVIARDPTAGR